MLPPRNFAGLDWSSECRSRWHASLQEDIPFINTTGPQQHPPMLFREKRVIWRGKGYQIPAALMVVWGHGLQWTNGHHSKPARTPSLVTSPSARAASTPNRPYWVKTFPPLSISEPSDKPFVNCFCKWQPGSWANPQGEKPLPTLKFPRSFSLVNEIPHTWENPTRGLVLSRGWSQVVWRAGIFESSSSRY